MSAVRSSPRNGVRRGIRWVVTGLFGLLYAYAVWNAVANLVQTVQTYSAVGVPLNALGWFLWLFAAVFPIIVFAASLALARRRGLGAHALVLLVGLALVAVFWLNVIGYSTVYTHTLIS